MIVMEGGGKLILLGGPPFSPARPPPNLRDLPAMRNIHVEVERINRSLLSTYAIPRVNYGLVPLRDCIGFMRVAMRWED